MDVDVRFAMSIRIYHFLFEILMFSRLLQKDVEDWKSRNTLYTLGGRDSKADDETVAVQNHMCYSCKNIGQALGFQISCLPQDIQDRFSSRDALVKEQIGEYLLEDENGR